MFLLVQLDFGIIEREGLSMVSQETILMYEEDTRKALDSSRERTFHRGSGCESYAGTHGQKPALIRYPPNPETMPTRIVNHAMGLVYSVR